MSAPTARKTAPRKTAAPKKAPAEVTPAPETATLVYTVTDDILRYTTKAGHDLVIDLDFPADLLNFAMGAESEDRSEDDQFAAIKASFGDNFEVAYGAMGIIERRRVQRLIFAEFQKAMSMPLGESPSSSDS